MRISKVIGIVIAVSSVVAGVFAGYKIATDDEIRGKLLGKAGFALKASRKKMDEMSEDVALRTAQLTKNPQINKDWVENQWEKLEY